MRVPKEITCPNCSHIAKRHCNPETYPQARCNWYCCEAPRKGMAHLVGCGWWTEITLSKSILGGTKWVLRKHVPIGVPPSSS